MCIIDVTEVEVDEELEDDDEEEVDEDVLEEVDEDVEDVLSVGGLLVLVEDEVLVEDDFTVENQSGQWLEMERI